MQKNVGKKDRMIRIIIGAVFLLLALIVLEGIAQIVFIILALAMFVTAIFRFCSIYRIFNINTCKNEK